MCRYDTATVSLSPCVAGGEGTGEGRGVGGGYHRRRAVITAHRLFLNLFEETESGVTGAAACGFF